jgi:transcriptional regulator of aromatic amino acid metabolism
MTTLHSPELAAPSDAGLLRALTSEARRPNLLIVCDFLAMSAVVEKVLTFCAAPHHFCVLPGRMDLPATKEGTIILADVATMTLSQQIALDDWLSDARANVQAVSITFTPLRQLVDEGRFLEGLYNRLNVVHLDAMQTADADGRPN